MKKVSFVVAILLALVLGLTSCSKDVEKCWKVDISMKMELMETTVTNYIWATENDLEYHIDNLKEEYDMPGIEIKVKKSTTRIKTEEDCYEKNDSMFDY